MVRRGQAYGYSFEPKAKPILAVELEYDLAPRCRHGRCPQGKPGQRSVRDKLLKIGAVTFASLWPHNYSAGGCSAGISGAGALSADCGAFSAGDCGAGVTT
jgi:hypothetical protein